MYVNIPTRILYTGEWKFSLKALVLNGTILIEFSTNVVVFSQWSTFCTYHELRTF